MDPNWHRFPWGLVGAVALGLFVIVQFVPPPEPPLPERPRVERIQYGPAPTLNEIKADGCYPLPLDDVNPGERLPGRPEEPMPIPRQIFERVELSIDRRPVTHEPIILSAGTKFRVDAMIYRNPDIPKAGMGGGYIGWVTRDNKRGWIVDAQFVGQDSHHDFSELGIQFSGLYTVPETPGEYVLVVIADYSVRFSKGMPILLAGAYDAVVTAPDAPSP